MSHDRTVMMANQIATFFATQRREDQAGRVAGHLRDFWAPEMRAALLAKIAAGEPGLHPLVLEAAEQLRERA
ncbi:formate dehydrogenase subunit delta [Amaricoccus sp.]|uniref:formate dehydrogenase subunit delta n=1 Tax=Amaricoccus sp. TaxID=1872485 RepID=UPI001B58AFBE|nr:formate dehydrogenase subunit delta [Amaricoccus sp.]MBP7001132.1 formate dehydrogenase subunit delta [Amaricoccus sp.]